MRSNVVWMPCTKQQYEVHLKDILENTQVHIDSVPCDTYDVLFYSRDIHALNNTSTWKHEKRRAIVIEEFNPRLFVELVFYIKYYNNKIIYS